MANDYVDTIDLDGEQWDMKDAPLTEEVSGISTQIAQIGSTLNSSFSAVDISGNNAIVKTVNNVPKGSYIAIFQPGYISKAEDCGLSIIGSYVDTTLVPYAIGFSATGWKCSPFTWIIKVTETSEVSVIIKSLSGQQNTPALQLQANNRGLQLIKIGE